jgi:hypothetical protein
MVQVCKICFSSLLTSHDILKQVQIYTQYHIHKTEWESKPSVSTLKHFSCVFCASLIGCCHHYDWAVYVVLMLDVIQMIFATHTTWCYVISGWGNPAILFQPPWSLTAMTFISSLSEHNLFLHSRLAAVLTFSPIVSAIVQVFFAWRIWMLQKSSLARGIAVLIVLVGAIYYLTSYTYSTSARLLTGNFTGCPCSVYLHNYIVLPGLTSSSQLDN